MPVFIVDIWNSVDWVNIVVALLIAVVARRLYPVCVRTKEGFKYAELVEALVTGSMDEHDRENAIKIALGELADVWPDSIKPKLAIVGLRF